mgnify:CR=1 FL=1
MKGYKYKDIMAKDFRMPTDRESLEAVYRTLAKTADQRMVRLEALGKTEGAYASATKWAYARAARDIKRWSGSTEKPRWNTKTPRTIGGLESKIEDIKTFLSSLTSTKKGIQEYMRRTTKINEKYGTDFTWDNVGKFFDSELNEKLEQKYGSKTILRAMANIKKNKNKILKDMEKTSKTRIVVPDKMVQSTVNTILKDYKQEVFEFLSK